MKRDALAFFRILPAGAADVGEGVSREDLRAAGAGDWSIKDVAADDLSDLFGDEYDEPILLDERPTDPGVPYIELKIGKAG